MEMPKRGAIMRLLRGVIKWCLGSVLICLISILTTWYVVNQYVSAVLGQFHITTPEQKLQLSQMISQLSEQAGSLLGGTSAQTAAPEGSGASGQGGGSSSPSGNNPEGTNPVNGSSSGAAGDAGKSQATSETEPDDAVAAWSQLGQQQRDKQKKVVISAQDFLQKKDELSAEDKRKIFSILSTRLPPEEIQKISGFVEDGITEDELKQLESIVSKYVKPEEYQQLLDILNKY